MPDTSRPLHPIAAVYIWLVVLLTGVTGVALFAGGGFLLSLGGSFYYLIAGAGLLLTAWYLVQRRFAAVRAYLGVFLFTAGWAFWEKGGDVWAQVPRMIAPAVVLVLVLIAGLVLRRVDLRPQRDAGTAALVVGFLACVAFLFLPRPSQPAAPMMGLVDVAAADRPAAVPGGIAAAPAATAGGDWPAYGGGYEAARYAPLTTITPANVADLVEVWRYETGDLPPEGEQDYSPENTPLKVGDLIYVCSAMGMVSALDAATGEELWQFDPQVSRDAIPYGATCRGVAYYAQTPAEAAPDTGAAETPDDTPAPTPVGATCATRIIWGTLDARLLAIDAVTGEPCADFGTGGAVDLNQGIGETVPGWYSVTSPPTILRGVAVLGAQVKDGQDENAPSGVVRGYDAVTGALVWAWDLGNPALTGEPPAGETYTRGTPNMWTIATGDEALGLVYLPMGNSSVDYYGSNRTEAENTYATALVAIDVTTGQPAWHFQTVINDVWDYDLGSQATLVDLTTEGGTVPALILPSKQGDIFVLDRRTGAPLHEVDMRPVPQGGVEPEYISAVQPFSGYHTLARPRLTEADMWGFTPIDQLWCRIQFRQATYDGIYTPPTTEQHWIQYPGYNGGSDWGGIAIDPLRGLILANYNDTPNYNRLVPRDEAEAAGLRPIYDPASETETILGEAGAQIGAPYAIDVNAGWRVPFTGLLCKEPPYGGIRAIDIATGQTVWDRPLGTARKNGPFGIPSFLPFEIGTPNNGGSVVTESGLIFIAAATDDLFRAIDTETGETLWEVALPAGGQSSPFAFKIGDREFVGLMAGGHHFMETPVGDEVIVWALP